MGFLAQLEDTLEFDVEDAAEGVEGGEGGEGRAVARVGLAMLSWPFVGSLLIPRQT